QLSPQEMLIARLRAKRILTPRSVRRLFLSSRTVECHLRQVFSKLSLIAFDVRAAEASPMPIGLENIDSASRSCPRMRHFGPNWTANDASAGFIPGRLGSKMQLDVTLPVPLQVGLSVLSIHRPKPSHTEGIYRKWPCQMD